MNPKKMNFLMKGIVKMVTKKKPVYEDYTDRGAVLGLVEYVKSLSL